MNKAALYRNSNNYTKYNSRKALQKYAKVFKWKLDGSDSVLDAGCGTGDVTTEILMPILPENFERLIGVDISTEMIEYARQTQIHPKLSFEIFNLEIALEKQFLNGINPFDHIFSFFCLMFIQNQKVCIQNFWKLLKPGGDIFLVFLAHHPVFDVYISQSQDNRWNKYMYDGGRRLRNAYQYSKNPEEDFENLLHDCGFSECHVKIEESAYIYDNIETMRDFFHSVNPFIDRIPDKDKQAYLNDLMHQLVQKCTEDIQTGQLKIVNKIFVAYARKSN